MTVLEGSQNCWPHWLGASYAVNVGTDASGNPLTPDQFLWLTQETVSCGTELAPVTGYANCRIGQETDCFSSQLARLGITSSSTDICVPAFTWEAR